LAYAVGWWVFSMQPGAKWPDDVVNRSYFRMNTCGAGTNYACPGGDTPVPRGNGSHLDPAGNLVVPPGAAQHRYN
jgi:hypothetical protein